MKNSFSLKAGVLLTTAFGIILVSGSIGSIAVAADALPAGFKAGSLSPEPSADMIEAGKRVYFTKCVWCHGVDGAGDGPGAIVSGRVPEISTREHSKFGTRPAVSCLCSMPRSPFSGRTICLIL